MRYGYDAENRLVSVTGASTANFYYDADGAQVKTTVNGVTTYYVGNHYEVKNSVVTKYYFAGSTRLAVRTNGTLSFLLGNHIGSSSVTTDANGVKTASALYKAFGETRFSSGNLGTDYKFTGQREEASLGIYFFNARWMDPSLGRFTSPDSIVPTSTQGTQAWDRYGYVNNNPIRYTDPTGHCFTDPITFAICVVAGVIIVAVVVNVVTYGVKLVTDVPQDYESRCASQMDCWWEPDNNPPFFVPPIVPGGTATPITPVATSTPTTPPPTLPGPFLPTPVPTNTPRSYHHSF
jgi:RHS repeat-associated protein